MQNKHDLSLLRQEIDKIDSQLVPLFLKRMDAASRVAAAKCEQNLPVLNSAREEEVVEQAQSLAPEYLKGETALLMRSIMALSREYQHRLLFDEGSPLLPPASAPVTQGIRCAYQGVEGAWSEQAAMQFFPSANRQARPYFEDVFTAVSHGEVDYGVVPIENSKTGAIGETYDLLRKHGCYIVGRTSIEIKQCLLAAAGTKIADVREIFSHPEAFKQCRRVFEQRNWELTACRNTAVAAQKVAAAGNTKTAAIASRLAAQLYGLEILKEDINDAEDNKTSFVAIAKKPEYNRESNIISLSFQTKHRSGALCEALLPFLAENLNLLRIESRPAADGQYRFFVDISGNVLDEKTAFALRQAAGASEYFEVLGCYSVVTS